jgi:DNA-binding transcriptional LysR family regulator
VACVSSFSIRYEIEAGHVHVVRVRDLALERPLSIVTRPGEPSPAVARFADFLRSKSQVPRAAHAARRKQPLSR